MRVVLPTEPTDLTSLNSVAYWSLVMSSGPSVRSWALLFSVNGFTRDTHAFGSLALAGSGRHSPGPYPAVNRKVVSPYR